MKKITATALLSATILISFHGHADACWIDNKRTTHIGLNKGVSGRCSNNGRPITCVLASNEGWECHGPVGTLHGFSVENVIVEACGCSLERESETRQQEQLMGN